MTSCSHTPDIHAYLASLKQISLSFALSSLSPVSVVHVPTAFVSLIGQRVRKGTLFFSHVSHRWPETPHAFPTQTASINQRAYRI